MLEICNNTSQAVRLGFLNVDFAQNDQQPSNIVIDHLHPTKHKVQHRSNMHVIPHFPIVKSLSKINGFKSK